jgi:hypothetical protein
MKIRDYLIASGISMIASALVLLFLWLFSLASWIFVWVIFVVIGIPIALKAIKIWEDESCFDLEDFIQALSKDKQAESSIEF